jgi:DNA-binding SARP family transcriptional activator
VNVGPGHYAERVAIRLGKNGVRRDVRVYLTGPLCLESGERLLGEPALPGPQGRHLLGFLAAGLWPGGLPAAWEGSLKSLISKIRAALSRAGLPGAELIRGAFGAYQFRLPPGGWVDVDAAALAVHLAEAALAAGDPGLAAREALVARLISARPFLPGVEGAWADGWRRRLHEQRIRAVETMASADLQRGQLATAIQGAELVLGLDDLRESSWRILMRAHAAAGNTGTALRCYERCRRALDEQLGAIPSPSTRAAHRELITS